MRGLLCNGGLQRHFHAGVQLAGMDVVARYQPLVVGTPALQYPALALLVAGMGGSRSAVREKAVSHLARLVAGMGGAVVPYQQGLLEAIERLVVVPSARDMETHAGEPRFFEAVYPLFFISASSVCGDWNPAEHVLAFFHVGL